MIPHALHTSSLPYHVYILYERIKRNGLGLCRFVETACPRLRHHARRSNTADLGAYDAALMCHRVWVHVTTMRSTICRKVCVHTKILHHNYRNRMSCSASQNPCEWREPQAARTKWQSKVQLEGTGIVQH